MNRDDIARLNQGCPMLGGTKLGSFLFGLEQRIGISTPRKLYVHGDRGDDRADGLDIDHPKKTAQAAINAAHAGDIIIVYPKAIAAGETDPASYEENLVIPPTKPGLALIGYHTGRCQGGLPQFEAVEDDEPIITIQAPGVLISGIGINGAGSEGGGVLFDDDSGTTAATKSAFGAAIIGCHFKNCKGSAGASTGGAIMWCSAGNAWQVLIYGNEFFDNVASIVLLGTSETRPKDVVIENNVFLHDDASAADSDISLGAGSGVNGVIVRNNSFNTVDVPSLSVGDDTVYVDLTGCNGALVGNSFACSGKTFGAAGNAGLVPATVRMANNWQEQDAGALTTGYVGRT